MKTKTVYEAGWHFVGGMGDVRPFDSENQAREFLFDLIRQNQGSPLATPLVETTVIKVTREEVDHWWAPGYPF